VNSLNGNAGVESEPAQPKSKSKVKLNFGLSPDFSVQLKVSLSDSLSERLSQKLKWLNAFYCDSIILLYTVNIFVRLCVVFDFMSVIVCLRRVDSIGRQWEEQEVEFTFV